MAKYGALRNDEKISIEFTDWRLMIKELNAIEPQIYKDMRKDFKKIGKPIQKDIKRAIPTGYPLGPRRDPRKGGSASGFNHSGRLAWGKQAQMNLGRYKPKIAKSVFIQTPGNKKPRSGGYRSVLRVTVNSAATSLADMAGRSGAYVNKYSVTKPYQIRLFGREVVTRTHRINNQGRALIDNLNSGARGKLKGNASRYAWPAAEKAMPAVQKAVVLRLYETYKVINSRFRGRF